MINTSFNQNKIYYSSATKPVIVSFGERIINSKPENDKKPDNRDFNPADGFNKYLLNIKTKKTISLDERILAEKISTGNEAEEIIHCIQNKEELNADVKLAEKIFNLLKKIAPEKVQTLKKMAENDRTIEEMRDALLGDTKPADFMDEKGIRDEEIVKEVNKKYKYKYADTFVQGVASCLKKGYQAQQLLKSLSKYKQEGKFSAQDEKDIKKCIIPQRFAAAQTESLKAQHKLIENNLKRVYWIAKQNKKTLNFEDVIGQANAGLANAARTFQYSEIYNFNAHAEKTIIGHIKRLNAETARAVKVAEVDRKDFKKIRTVIDEYDQNLNQRPTPEELQKETGLKPKKIKELCNLYQLQNFTSLSQPIDNIELIDTIADKDISTEEKIIINDNQEKLKKLSIEAGLTPKEAEVMILRFGENKLSQVDISNSDKQWGTANNVHLIEKNARKKLIEKFQEADEAEKTTPQEKQRIKETMMSELTRKERQIINIKLGVFDPFSNKITDREVGDELNISGPVAYKYYKRAMTKLEDKAGITETDIKKCGDYSGVKELQETWKEFLRNNE